MGNGDNGVVGGLPYRMSNVRSYMQTVMPGEMQAFAGGGRIKSGYANLDAITNLYPGLYVLGAISSLGKTTWASQMSDQIASSGKPVLFFSLEQSTLELASKALSRTMALSDARTAMTSLQIRKHGNDPRVVAAVQAYSDTAARMYVVECSFQATIDVIESVVSDYVKKTNTVPVVVVDYLQVIQPPADSRMTTKDLVDMHVRRLKQLQVSYGLVLIVISSLNRQNYLSQIDFESFKESGGIEYTADVVWGLQLSVLHDPIFDTQAKLNEKREKVRNAKAENPRKVELLCLKNRFGVSSYSCQFEYFPQFDLFRPIIVGGQDQIPDDLEVDPDGFIKVPDGYETDIIPSKFR